MKNHKSPILAALICGFTPSTVPYSFAQDMSHENNTVPLLGMTFSTQEQDAIHRSIGYGREISSRAEKINGRPFRRDAHAKATGCVRATFTINGDIPSRFRYSIFSKPTKQFQAWIRFSNGDMVVQPDKKPDARGMAIKVVGVEGDKIAPELKGPAIQDFIMANTPAFFNRNIIDYAEDMRYLAKLQRTRWFISIFPPRLHPKQFMRAIEAVSGTIINPLAPQYYSMLPYQLGGNELKFSAKPCQGTHLNATTNKNRPDFLTTAMVDTLATKDACFDFMLQAKVPGASMPIDDATVIWSEKRSPFIPVARVYIPSQQFTGDKQQQFCENLSMNPWHGVDEWQPLGSLNRARRVVYNAVSKFRHNKNNIERFQPINWCLERNGQCDQTTLISNVPTPNTLSLCFDSLYKPIDGHVAKSQCKGSID